MKPTTAMNQEFYTAFKESSCDWITYAGGWMIYDGALFVHREGF